MSWADTCLIYAKTLSDTGYGMLYSGGRRIRAHRAMYEAVKGPIPEGLVLDHLCRNRACVNPDHLEAVTNRENILRGVGASAQHAKKTHCTEGHRLAPGNLVTITTRPNVRRCRICDNVLRKKRYHRNKQGESHMATQLTKTEYVMLHKWVRRELGKPSLCENCGTTEAKQFDWANLSGEYLKDLSDWARLCKSCHTIIDKGKPECPRGHKYTVENTYMHPDGSRKCRQCHRIRRRKDRSEYEAVPAR